MRLKQLMEDLVDVSRISSGNITLQMDDIDLVELVRQTGGEFNEKLEQKGLNVISKFPKEAVMIYADGRQDVYKRQQYIGDVIESTGSRQDEDSIAQHLYAILRDFDERDVNVIFSESFATPRIGHAIMNRLLKAAGHQVIEV